MKKKFKGTYVYLILVVVLTLFVFYGTSRDLSDTSPKMSALDVMTAIENKEIKSIEQIISSGDDGKFIITDKDGNKSTISVAQEAFSNYIYNLSPELRSSFKFTSSEPQTSLFFPIMQIVLIIGMFIFIMIFFVQQMQGGGGGGGRIMNFGKSKAKMTIDEKGNITFKNVAGLEEEKEEVAEIVDFLKNQNRYIQVGAKIPKGVLLVGPPGTGKTLLAKAVAGEAGVPFFSISGSDFVEMFVGVGASRVRDLFEQAKKNSPALIFIDEIDAVGRQRGAGLGGGHDEREQTLNQLLVEMDGFGANEGIIMIAATNRPDILDPALLRPGRFDRQIVVQRPDRKGREAVLKVHTHKKPLAVDVDLEVLAKRTPGFSGADLENLANEAALLAVRKSKKAIGMDEFEEAITRVIAGPEKKSRAISEHDRKLTAYHEAGHAVVMKCLKHSDPVHEISIIPRGMAGGYTMHLPTEDRAYTSKEKLQDEMVGLLGGRVAEKLILGDISTGAKNDIDRASSIARAMVMEYGMSDEIGTISYGSDNNEVFLGRDLGRGRNFSEEIGAEIDKEVKKFIEVAYARAEDLLKTNINKLHAVANELLDKEKIDGKEFEMIFDAN